MLYNCNKQITLFPCSACVGRSDLPGIKSDEEDNNFGTLEVGESASRSYCSISEAMELTGSPYLGENGKLKEFLDMST